LSQSNEQPHVKASIVIVAWRLVDELRECLDSVAASVDAPPFEVILVLNGAPAEAAEIGHSHPIVTRVITRYANIGYGAACNLAAAQATGDNIVFLNDDTVVDPFWLKTLVDASVPDDRQAVTSLLLNFDGTVQEAGSRILTHGGTQQIAKGATLEEATAGGALERRMVDYGSGAALLVRRAAFESIGGFDVLFEPAYFEDVDMELRLREKGIAIWLEPDAKVLHHSGKSTITDRWFRMFAANRSGQRFIERWAHILVSAPAVDDALDALCVVPLTERELATTSEALSLEDNSATVALAFSRDYEAWLVDRLEQHSDIHDIATSPSGPKRAELIRRILDLESRGPVGVAKMRAGLWMNQRLRTIRDRRVLPEDPEAAVATEPGSSESENSRS
jgi:GT2 family glycosyltransferase